MSSNGPSQNLPAGAYDALLRDKIRQAEEDVRQGNVVDGEEFFARLRAKIDRGIADFEAGRTFSHEEVFAQIREKTGKP